MVFVTSLNFILMDSWKIYNPMRASILEGDARCVTLELMGH